MKNEAEEEPTFLFNNELIARLLPRDLTLFNYLVGGLNPNKPRKDKCKIFSVLCLIFHTEICCLCGYRAS